MDDDSGELVKEEVAGIARGELEPATVNLEVHSPVTLCTSGSSRWCLISHEFGSAPWNVSRCCCADSERLRHCYHLLSKVENINHVPNIPDILQRSGSCPCAPKKPFSLGVLRLLFNTWFSVPTQVDTQTTSQSIQPFLHSSHMWPT